MSSADRPRRLLDRRGARWLLAGTESIRLTSRRREPVLVRPHDGWWVHRYPRGTFFHPSLDFAPPPELYESIVLNTLCRRYTPAAGDVVVDVGAATGEGAFTFSAMVGPEGRVVCVEAHPETFERLVAMLRLNGMENVETANVAVADHAGEVEISDEPATQYFARTLIQPPSAQTRRVPADTLDGVYERFDLERVDLLKMNIEGAEGLAVAGWTEALRRTRNVAIACHDFLLEENADAASDLATFDLVRSAVEGAGFRVHTRLDDPRPWARYYVYGSKE